MDSLPDSLVEVDDEVYLCKKCKKILEEGRAFELGGNRWHVECFRCSNCDSQLDCDTNLLVLGNGDLICGSCCYSCCACGKKIDDLAILTGKDNAFCAKCFKCRNCKLPIENLRYARTSQGIFCMSCHEKLIERRRRNKLKSAKNTSKLAAGRPGGVDAMLMNSETSINEKGAESGNSISAMDDTNSAEKFLPSVPLNEGSTKPTFLSGSVTTESSPELLEGDSKSQIDIASHQGTYQSNLSTSILSGTSSSEAKVLPELSSASESVDSRGTSPESLDQNAPYQPLSEESVPKEPIQLSNTGDSLPNDDTVDAIDHEIARPSSRSTAIAAAPYAPGTTDSSIVLRNDVENTAKLPTSTLSSSPPAIQSMHSQAIQSMHSLPSSEGLLSEFDSPGNDITVTRTDSSTSYIAQSPVPALQDEFHDTVQGTPAEQAQAEPTFAGELVTENHSDSPQILSDGKLSQDILPLRDAQESSTELNILKRKPRHEPKRSFSSASSAAGTMLRQLSRSHSVSLSSYRETTTMPTSKTIEHNNAAKQKRSPFLFGVPFGLKREKTPATPFESAVDSVSSTDSGVDARDFDSRSRSRYKNSPQVSSPRTPSSSPGPISEPSKSPYISLPSLKGNADFSLEEDFANILSSKHASPRTPASNSGTRSNHLQNLLRKPSRSTLRSFVTGGPSPSRTDMRKAGVSPSPVKNAQRSPYMFYGDSPELKASQRDAFLDNYGIFSAAKYPLNQPALEDGELAKVKYDLSRANDKIADLEAQLANIEYSDSRVLEDEQKIIADLESKIIAAKVELGVLSELSSKVRDGDDDKVVARFEEQMDSVKRSLLSDLNALVSQRNTLLAEISRLTRNLEDLRAKNRDLEAVHHNLTMKIQESFKEYKESHSTSLTNSDAIAGRELDFHQDLQHSSDGTAGEFNQAPMVHPRRQRHPNGAEEGATSSGLTVSQSISSASPSPSYREQSSATSVDGQDFEDGKYVTALEPSAIISSSSGGHSATNKKKFWQRRGEIVAKGAVRGFNKFFTNDTSVSHNISHETATDYGSEGTAGSHDEQSTNGLNIILPRSSSAVGSIDLAQSGTSKSNNNITINGRKLKASALSGNNNIITGDGHMYSDEPTEVGLFDVDITERSRFEGRLIPYIVIRCVEEVESRGMDVEGIYRRSGTKSQSDQLQLIFEQYKLPSRSSDSTLQEKLSAPFHSSHDALKDRGNLAPTEGVILTPELIKLNDEFNEAMQGDICAITSTLKQYLRRLPVPLITYDSYLQFIGVADQSEFEAKLRILTQVMKSLPSAHLHCLEFLARHLSRVVSHSDKNLMTSLNLAVVFAPTLARDVTGAREMTDAHKRNNVVKFMIDNSERIFAVDVGLV